MVNIEAVRVVGHEGAVLDQSGRGLGHLYFSLLLHDGLVYAFFADVRNGSSFQALN